MRHRIVLAALVVTTLPTVARADRLAPGVEPAGPITDIGAGTMELSLEAQGLHRSQHDQGTNVAPDTTTTGTSFVGAAVFRYFVVENLSVAAHVGGYTRSDRSKSGYHDWGTSELGFVGTASLSYSIPLGGGVFLAPLVGGGWFAGSLDEEAAPPSTAKASRSVSGPVARGGVGVVFYPSARLALFLRPEALAYFGKASSASSDVVARPDLPGYELTRTDTTVTVGVSWVF